MRLEVLQDWEEVQALRPAWLHLLNTSAADSLHNTPEWMECWLTTLGRQNEIRFVVALENGELTGLLPIVVAKAPWVELGGRRLEFLSGRRADYHDAIVRRGREEEVTPLLLKQALPWVRRTGVLVLHHLPEDSPNLPLFRSVLTDLGFKVSEISSKAPYLKLDRTLPNFSKQWRKSHRDDLKRQRKRLQERGAMELTIYHDSQQVLDQLPGFFETHRQSWLARGKRSLVGNNPGTQEFLRRIVTTLGCELPRKRVHFSTLDLNGKPISYHFGFVYGEVFLYYLPTHVMEFESYSPGKLHLHHLIEHGLAHESWRIFDFMAGDEPYKYMWTKTEKEIYDLVVSRPFSLGSARRWWLGSGKELARCYLAKLQRLRPSRSAREKTMRR